MAEIRPMQREDLPAVAQVWHDNLYPDPIEQTSRFLADTLFDDPWRDDELPSLVACENGEVIGFVGSQARTFRRGDQLVRGTCASHLTVDAQRRGGAAGALLLRRLLTAGQQFTFTDTASDEVVRIWQALGGRLDAARACDWMLVLRPVRWLGGLGGAALKRGSASRERVPVGAIPFHSAGPRIVRRAFPPLDTGVEGANAGDAEIVAELPATTRGVSLRAAYDQPFLDHCFSGIEARVGPVVRRIVRRQGRPIGWYAYAVGAGQVGRTMHVAAARTEAEAVVGELVAHARQSGLAVISGRLEPHLQMPLRRRMAILGFARQAMLHSHEPELLAALGGGEALLTRLDSEWFAA